MGIRFKKKIFFSWLWVVLCSISIFLIVPAGRTIQKFVSDNWGEKFFVFFVLGILGLALIFLICFLIFKLKIRSPSNYVWLFLITGTYTYFTLKLISAPVEAAHFLEYGLLGFFLFKALSHHVRDKSIYFTATLFALLVGTFDEIIQWIIPLRYWDFRDVGFNALSGALFQLTLLKVVKPKIISEKIKVKSVRIFTSICAVCLIVLGLCTSNTTKRVAYYSKLIPRLSFLQKEEPMSEFGYRYKDPDVGIFYSRISMKDLRKKDTQKGEHYAQILNKSVNEDYDQFLREYNPISDPFMYELRVHIFRRDTYFEKARASSSLDKKKESCFIAYKENLILKKYFAQSIGKSVYSWDEDRQKESESLMNTGKLYKSPVSSELITAFSEKSMWIWIFTLLAVLVLINFFWKYLNTTFLKLLSFLQ